MKILLIAGHGAGDPGACSNYGTEAVETRKVVEMLKSHFKSYEATVDVYPISRNAYTDAGSGTLQVNFADYDYVLEIHFNSSVNTSATGVEIWVTSSELVTTVEQAIVNKIAALGYPNRGVKKEDFRVIRTAKNCGTSSALLEVCFISNKNDMTTYNAKFSDICKATVNAIGEEFGLKKTGAVIENKPVQTPIVEQPKTIYRVKTVAGKQLGAFGVLENAKNMASKNNAIVYDANGKVLYSYVPSNKKYLNLKPHVATWRVYPTNVAPVVKNSCGSLTPKTYGGLSYEILANPQTDVYTIQTSMLGKVNIYAPKDNHSSITENPIY